MTPIGKSLSASLHEGIINPSTRGVREFYSMLNDLPPASRMKLLQRMRRRQAAAGQSLATDPEDLSAHRDRSAVQK